MKKNFKIEGMSCGHCVMAVNKSLGKLELKKVNVQIGSAEVEYDESNVNENEIIKAIKDAGYIVIN